MDKRAGAVIRDQLRRVLADARSWQRLAKQSESYQGDLTAIEKWIAEPEDRVEFPPMLTDAGDETPNLEMDPVSDPSYPGSNRQKAELRNDLVRVLHMCRIHGVSDIEAAHAVLCLLEMELAVCAAAEVWGSLPSHGHEDVTKEFGALTAALRDIGQRRKQRKCDHGFLSGDGQCYKCQAGFLYTDYPNWIKDPNQPWENIMERGRYHAEVMDY